MSTEKESSGRRRFAAACGVLSRRVRAEAAERMALAAAAAAQNSRPAQQAAEAECSASSSSSTTMLLMPGADVEPDVMEEGKPEPSSAQLTIVYGGRVLVFDSVAAETAAELMRVAARDAQGGGDMMPVARKASLQRFMEKRRGRLGQRAPYAAAVSPAPASKKGQQDEVGDNSGCWLGLGISGGCAR